jgi:hypothetical protein
MKWASYRAGSYSSGGKYRCGRVPKINSVFLFVILGVTHLLLQGNVIYYTILGK